MSDHPTPRPFECPKCERVHTRCLGHNAAHLPCGQMPVNGCDVCVTHGARAPQVAAAARARVEAGNAQRAATTLGHPIEVDPVDAVLEELARTNGIIHWVGEIIAGLAPDEVVFGLTSVGNQEGDGVEGSYIKEKYGAGVHAWVKLYQAERSQLLKVSAVAISAGIQERQLRIAEQVGHLFASVVRKTLGDPQLGLTAEQLETGHRLASQHMRSLPGVVVDAVATEVAS